MADPSMQLLEHGLGDMYDAEQRFVQALQTMERNATDKSLANGFKRHREITQKQVQRLKECFQELGKPARREPCKGAQGLIEEYESFASDHRGENDLLDAFSASAGLKTEHYEIASYRTLVDLAEYCGENGVARKLKQTLAEEEQAAAEMQSSASMLSAKLAGAPVRAVAGRAVGSMIDQAREGTMAAIGGARAVAGRAVRRSKATSSKEKSKRGSAKSSTSKRSASKGSTSRSASGSKRGGRTTATGRSPAKRATARASSTASRARNTTANARRKTTSRARSTAQKR